MTWLSWAVTAAALVLMYDVWDQWWLQAEVLIPIVFLDTERFNTLTHWPLGNLNEILDM